MNPDLPVCTSLQFPWKMHVLLSETEKTGRDDIISWQPDGNCFKIHNKERFEEEVMPTYFKTKTFRSFQRNLNLWGFETISRGFERGVIRHRWFQKGYTELCNNMSRNQNKRKSNDTTGGASSSQSLGIAGSHPVHALHQPQGNASSVHESQEVPSVRISEQQQISLLLVSHQQRLLERESEQRKQQERAMLIKRLMQNASENTRLNANSIAFTSRENGSNQLNDSPMIELLRQRIQEDYRNQISMTTALLPLAAALADHRERASQQQELDQTAATLESILALHSIQTSSTGTPGLLSSFGENTTPRSTPQSTPSVQSSTVADEEKRIPCRARGMPLDHNEMTAFFCISKSTPHGSDLICFHRGCREAGIKFRYCAHCQLPAAKRTFWNLHGHPSARKQQRIDSASKEAPQAPLAAAHVHTTQRVAVAEDSETETLTKLFMSTAKSLDNEDSHQVSTNTNPLLSESLDRFASSRKTLGERPLQVDPRLAWVQSQPNLNPSTGRNSTVTVIENLVSEYVVNQFMKRHPSPRSEAVDVAECTSTPPASVIPMDDC